MKLLKTIIVGMLVLGSALPSLAGEYTIFGPNQFVRGSGQPLTTVKSFNSPATGPGFTLKVQNGDSQGSNRASSARLDLNGNQLFGPADFNQQTSSMQRRVSLSPSNDLSVNLGSAPASVLTITVTGEDDTPPQINITIPLNGSAIATEIIDVSGTVNDDTPVNVMVNGVPAMVIDGTFTATGVPLAVGQNTITATAIDFGGNVSRSSIVLIREIQPPNVAGMTQAEAQSALIAVTLAVGNVTSAYNATIPLGNIISQSPSASAWVVPGAYIDLVVSKGPAMVSVPKVVGMTQTDAEAAIIAVYLQVGSATSVYSNSIPAGIVMLQNPAANALVAQETAIALVISGGPSPVVIPPNPATVAPPVDSTVATSVASSTAFLYSGNNPIQTGVAVGTIEVKRAAVLRGQVNDRDGNPLSGVTVSILGHPEFGQTLTRVDGMFDMAVNGGGLLAVTYEKTDYLSVQRQVNALWQDYAWLPVVALIPVDAPVTTITFASANQIQVHQGGVVTDLDGSRQATLLFSPGTTAQMVMPDGSTQPVNSLSIRATEYTVGPNGPKSMPGQLPPASGYTYAVELSADEAIATGAKQVTFSQPVYVYVDNFIGFPVGEPVPSGYYDREIGQWIASQNGRVINILSITGGLADIDTNGDGMADDATTLAALGITQAERQQLAALNPQTPKQLWRVPVTHFSAWDFNWPFAPPVDAIAPKLTMPKSAQPTSKPCEKGGSIIECQNQVLGERLRISGTSFTLNYRSSRFPGHATGYRSHIPISGATVPANLKRIDLIIQVAGRQFSLSFPASANQSYTFFWDGKDAYGQAVQGKQPLTVQIGYVYGGVYLTAKPAEYGSGYDAMFARFSYFGTRVTGSREEREVTLWQTERLSIGGFIALDAQSLGLGGWDLDIHHVYDPVAKVLLLGDGNWRSADSLGTTIITTVAGDFPQRLQVAAGPDGNIYVADAGNNRVKRIGPDGVVTTVAGGGAWSPPGIGDGGPATSASLDYPGSVAVGPDGSIYTSDNGHNRVRRVGPDGIIDTVAGGGTWTLGIGDGGPATSAWLDSPGAVAVGPDGSLYISDIYNFRVRRVGADGIITTVAGNGNRGYSGDGGPATSASFYIVAGIAFGLDGSMYITDSGNNRIRRVGTDGIITTVAGDGSRNCIYNYYGYACYGGDGGPATSASLYGPGGIAFGPDGSLYIADTSNHRIRRVRPDGIITTEAGKGANNNGYSGYGGDGGPATSASLRGPTGIAVGPDGSLYIADTGNGRIRRLAAAWPGLSITEIPIPSEDGSQLYVFNGSGKHLRTLNALTGATLYNFGYDSGGRLASVTDGAGNVTTVERDSNGNPTAIIAPFGQRTAFTLDVNGYLASMTNPAGESTRMGYNDGGLMTTFSEPNGSMYNFAYDASGLLVRDANPAGGYTTLSGTSTPSTKQQTVATALGKTSTYLTEYLSTVDQRLTITTPTGAQNTTLTKTDGSTQSTMSDGTTSTLSLGTDPRFGTLVYIPASTTTKTPSGLTQSITLARTAMLADPNNLLSLINQTDTLNINSRVYKNTYNSASRTYTLTTPAGRSSSSTIDAKGRPVSLLPAAGLTPVTYSYDAQGFLTNARRGALVTTYGYDTLKRVSSVTNADGKSLGFTYFNSDRVSTLTLPSGRSYQFTYDANGNRTQITMPSGAVHRLGYTIINLGSDYTSPGNLPYAWQYSLDQEWTRTILPGGRTVDAAYDAGGRSTGIVYAEASVGILYNDNTDRISSLVRTSTSDGTTQQIAYSYDGSLVTGQTFSGADNGKFNYIYDNNFFLKQINLVSGTNSVMTPITRDADGLVTGYGTFSFTRSGPAGAVSQISDTAMNLLVTYDALGRVAGRTQTVKGQNIYSMQLTYDSLGNISRKVETVSGTPTTFDYTYDADGQLTAVYGNGSSWEHYTYDLNGNRALDVPGTASFDAEDRIIQQLQTNYQFNLDGQLLQRNSDTFQYSAQGELLQSVVAGKTVTYTHDGMGRRVARTDSTGTSQYLYGNLDQPFQLTAMRDPAGLLSTFYYDDAGVMFSMDKNSSRYYIAADQVGTLKVVSDSTGTIVKAMTFDSFGFPQLDSNPSFTVPVGFAGGLTDENTGLVRFGYRDYDPYTGRWTAKDPIFFNGGQGNLYVYVQNNPIRYVDPYGLAMSDVPGAVVTAVSGAVNAITSIATKGPPVAQATLALAGTTVLAPFAPIVGPEVTGASAPAITTFIYKMATISPGKPTLQRLKETCGF